MKSLRPTIPLLSPRAPKTITQTARARGSALIDRRLRLWKENPVCALCGCFVDYPRGFELDHIVPLSEGGGDGDSNLQILCVWWDVDGSKLGCHADKTAREASERSGGGLNV